VDIFEDFEENLEDDSNENFEYKLVGAVLHSGSADFGHYISLANIDRGAKDETLPDWNRTEKDRWIKFNDTAVTTYK
jgi:ubiquitin C-terminal hydrolase